MNICFTDTHLIRHSVILNCSLFGQSFKLGHYPLIYQLPKGVDLLNNQKKVALKVLFSALGIICMYQLLKWVLCTKIIIIIIIIIIINCNNNSNNNVIFFYTFFLLNAITYTYTYCYILFLTYSSTHLLYLHISTIFTHSFTYTYTDATITRKKLNTSLHLVTGKK